MPLVDKIQRWIKEPPPEYLFEVSERGIAHIQPRDPSSLRVHRFEEKALTASPSQPNFTRPDLMQAAIPGNGKASAQQKKVKAALVVPDYSTRLSVLDFEELPEDAVQREALVRFRLRKSVPFPIDEARVSSAVQWNEPQHKKVEVLAAAIAHPILEEYESLLVSRGFQVGVVVPSSIAALALCPPPGPGLTLLAKLSGSVLSILLTQQGWVRVVRCVDLTSEESASDEEPAIISTLLHQTFAFIEDELAQPAERLLLCGFGEMTHQLGVEFETDFRVSWQPLTSRFGPASQENAGVLGLAEQYAA